MAGRKGRNPLEQEPTTISQKTEQDMLTISAQLRTQLQSYLSFTATINNPLKDVNQLQSELDVDMKPINLLKGRLDRAYEGLTEQTEEELKRIDQSLVTLDLLLETQLVTDPANANTGPVAPVTPLPTSSPPIPASSAGKPIRGPYKKRKLDDASANPSPIPSSAPSPQGSLILLPRQPSLTLNSPTLPTAYLSSPSTSQVEASTSAASNNPIAQAAAIIASAVAAGGANGLAGKGLLPPQVPPPLQRSLSAQQQQQKMQQQHQQHQQQQQQYQLSQQQQQQQQIQQMQQLQSLQQLQQHIPQHIPQMHHFVPLVPSVILPPTPLQHNLSASTPSHSTPTPSTTTTKKVTVKSKKEQLAGQLPLEPGRQVAFKQPYKGLPNEVKKEDWILARIVSMVQGDKSRYIVEDVDYDPANPTPDGGRYTTNLKSIIPLPDMMKDRSKISDHDYPVGHQVMALYPDTTAFYRAEIMSRPESIFEKGKGKKEAKTYKLKFEDDDDEIRTILAELVVELP